MYRFPEQLKRGGLLSGEGCLVVDQLEPKHIFLKVGVLERKSMDMKKKIT